MKKTISSSIVLNGLELNVNIGWPEAERIPKQIVVVDIYIRFAEPPHACKTDRLSDTYCYDTLTTSIKKMIDGYEFRLIEHLSYELYHIVKKTLSEENRVFIRVTKKPHIEGLTGGVSFCYGDED